MISQNRLSYSMLSIFSGGRDPDELDLPSHFGQKFQLSVNFHTPVDHALHAGHACFLHSDGCVRSFKVSVRDLDCFLWNNVKSETFFV